MQRSNFACPDCGWKNFAIVRDYSKLPKGFLSIKNINVIFDELLGEVCEWEETWQCGNQECGRIFSFKNGNK
jgi:hypothetical protein